MEPIPSHNPPPKKVFGLLNISLTAIGPLRSFYFSVETTVINTTSGVNDSGSQRLLQEVLSQAVHSFKLPHRSPQDNNVNCPAALGFFFFVPTVNFLTMQTGFRVHCREGLPRPLLYTWARGMTFEATRSTAFTFSGSFFF